jgi:hypothetical protein
LVLTLIAVLMPLVAGILGAVGLWCLVAVAFAWDHWERVEKVFGRLLGFASFVGGRAERTALSAEMQGVINGARKEIQEEVADAMPLPARVRFVRDDADIAELKDGEVVISLRNPRRRAENTARATIAYVSAATIRPARLYVGQTVMTGIEADTQPSRHGSPGLLRHRDLAASSRSRAGSPGHLRSDRAC